MSEKEGEDTGILVDEKIDLKEPVRFKVILHNDDYTTMDFVVKVLQVIFGKTKEEANEITLKVHKDGIGICGVYCFEVAETKAKKVEQMATNEGHPLKISVEEE